MSFKIIRICTLSIFLMFKDSLSINSFEEIFESFIPYLQQYNDVSIDNVVLLYSIESGYSGCLEEFDVSSIFYKWGKYVPLNLQENYLEMLEELNEELQGNTKSLVFVCNRILSVGYKSIFNHLSSHLFSENTWLLINPNHRINSSSNGMPEIISESENQSLRSNIKFDSQVYVFEGNTVNGKLYEIYRPCPYKEIKTNILIEFSDSDILQINSEFIWQRRQNLMGCEFAAGYIEQKYGFYEIQENEFCPAKIFGTNKIICAADRWYTSLAKELIKDFNMTLSFLSPLDNQYGVRYRESNNWTGVVGLLQQEKVEFAFVLLTFTTDRDEVMDFGIDLGFEYLILYMARTKASIIEISFNEVFNICYWILLLATGMLVCFCYALLQNFNRGREVQRKEKCYLLEVEGINAGISLTYRALLGLDVRSAKHLENLPSRVSIRICLLTACLLGMFNRDTFYAGLASLLTIEPPLMPISSLEDVLSNPGYRLSVMKGTTIESYFSNSDDSVAQKLWEEKEDKIISNDGKIMAEKQILSDPKLVYVGTESFQEVSINYPCAITKLSQKYGQKSLGFGFRTNSSYQKLFNYKISQYKSYGIKSQLQKDTEKANTMGCSEANEYWHSLGLSNIPLPFKLVLIGIAFALTFLIFEIILHYKKLQSKTAVEENMREQNYQHSIHLNTSMKNNLKVYKKSPKYTTKRRRSSF